MTFSRFGGSYGTGSTGLTSPYVPRTTTPLSLTQPRTSRGFPERIPGDGQESWLVNAATEASQLVPQTYERPLAPFNVVSKGLAPTGDKPPEGIINNILGFIGGIPLPGLMPKVDSSGNGLPVKQMTISDLLGAADTGLQRSGTITSALVNARDIQQLQYVVDNKLPMDALVSSGKYDKNLNLKKQTVQQFLDDLHGRGFDTKLDPATGELLPVSWDEIATESKKDPLGAFQYGDKAVSTNAALNLAWKIGTDPTNWVFGSGIIGKAALKIGLTEGLARTAGQVARWGRPPALVGQASIGELEALRGVGYMDDMAQLGLRSAEIPSVSASAAAMSRGNMALGTLKGLGQVLKQIYLPGRGSLGLRYLRGATIQQAGWFGLSEASGALSNAYDPRGVDVNGNPIRSGIFSTIHDAADAILNDRPLSGDPLFQVATMFGAPYHEAVTQGMRTYRTAVRPKLFGGDFVARLEREGFDTKHFGNDAYDEVAGQFDPKGANPEVARQQLSRLADRMTLDYAAKRAKTDPNFKLWAQSMDEVAGSMEPVVDALTIYRDELVANGKITSKDLVRTFRDWVENQTTTALDEAGNSYTITHPGAWAVPENDMIDIWNRYAKVNESVSTAVGPLRDAIVGRGQAMTQEGMDNLLTVTDAAAAEATPGWGTAIPSKIVRGVFIKRPAMFTDPRIPINVREYFAALMNEGVAAGKGVHGAGPGLYDYTELRPMLQQLRDRLPTNAELFHEARASEAKAIDDTVTGQKGPLGRTGVEKLWTQKEITEHRVRSTSEGRALQKDIKAAEEHFAQMWTKRGNYKPEQTARKAAPEMLDRAKEPDGGGSFDPVSGKWDETQVGYAVGLHEGTFATVAQGDKAAMADAAAQIAREFPGDNVGVWHNPDTGMIEVDPSRIVFDRAEADALAVQNNQKAIFDLEKGESIPNPHYKVPAPGAGVAVPAGALEVGTDLQHITSPKINGQTIRGRKVISPADGRIPDTVYHVTTDKPAVEASGVLRARGEGGLGGDKNDRVVSMTIDKDVAVQLEKDIKFNAKIHQTPVADIPKALEAQAESEGWLQKWLDGGLYDENGVPFEFLKYGAGDWLTHYFNVRRSAVGTTNPIIFGEAGKTVDPAKVGIIEIPKESLNNGALLVDFDLADSIGLKEIRSYGDVSLGPKPSARPVPDLEAMRNAGQAGIHALKAELASVRKYLLDLRNRSEELGVVPLHNTFRGRDGKLVVSGEELRKVQAQTEYVRDNFPDYEVKKPPRVHLPWEAGDSVAGALWTQRTNLGRILFDAGPISKLAQLQDYLLEPVKASLRVRDAHRQMYSTLMPMGASEDEVTKFIAEIQRRRHEAGTLGPMKIRVARNENSLLTSQIQQAGEAVFGPDTVTGSSGNTAVMAALKKQYGGEFYRVLDQAANSLVRKGLRAMMKEGETKLSGQGLLAKTFTQGYDAWQHTQISKSARFIDKIFYPLFRFYASPRWQLMNLLENDLLGMFQDGIRVNRFSRMSVTGAADRQYSLAQARAYGTDPRLTGEMSPESVGVPQDLIPETGAVTAGHFMDPVMRRQFELRRASDIRDAINQLPVVSPEAKWMVDHFGTNKGTWAEQLQEMWTQWDKNGVKATLDAEVAKVSAYDKWTPEEIGQMQPFLLRLGERQSQIFDDIAHIQLGNTDRSRLERALNSYWAFWPLSYQIKTTKWMVDMLSNRMFGRTTNLGGAYMLNHIREIYTQQMTTNPQFRQEMDSQPTLQLVANMLMPAVPWDQAVSMSRIPRYVGGNILHWWPAYDYIRTPADAIGASLGLGSVYDAELISRILHELHLFEKPPSVTIRSQ